MTASHDAAFTAESGAQRVGHYWGPARVVEDKEEAPGVGNQARVPKPPQLFGVHIGHAGRVTVRPVI